ncbi:hypothetical protein BV898_19100 [Hypsibius exemplaris]|uniref:Uncharacterized protein n=1 Tax=Hypsibius exemplaris TaxID=2072580 RepID=A0A9X6NRI2_HYPEX|nr:hypothetical protein BV898_19100 [Hypsibius exemplaris]
MDANYYRLVSYQRSSGTQYSAFVHSTQKQRGFSHLSPPPHNGLPELKTISRGKRNLFRRQQFRQLIDLRFREIPRRSRRLERDESSTDRLLIYLSSLDRQIIGMESRCGL